MTMILQVIVTGLPRWLSGKEAACHLWDGTIPWGRKWQPTPVFLPGESHGQRSLDGYSPWGRKELATTEQLTISHIFHCTAWNGAAYHLNKIWGFPGVSDSKESAYNAEDPSSIPG